MKVILVGMGGMGNAWLRTVLESAEVEFAGFVEVNPAIVDEQTQKYGLDAATVFPTLDAALAAVPADGVINVTPPQFHRAISVAALEAGVPVLSEKPLADTFEDAEAIARVSDETGVLLMVAQNYRYSVPIQTLKGVLASGDMGAVGGAAAQFFRGPHFGGFREAMAYPLVVDMAIHHFDLMRFLLDRDPVAVSGQSWNPPWSWYAGDASANVLFEFDGEVHVNYTGSWCSQGRETPWNGHWRIECERGVVTLENDRVYVQRMHDVEPGEGYRNTLHEDLIEVAPVQLPRVAQAYLLHEFYEAVTVGRTPATTAQDNLKSLAMVFRTVEAFKSGGRAAIEVRQ